LAFLVPARVPMQARERAALPGLSPPGRHLTGLPGREDEQSTGSECLIGYPGAPKQLALTGSPHGEARWAGDLSASPARCFFLPFSGLSSYAWTDREN